MSSTEDSNTTTTAANLPIQHSISTSNQKTSPQQQVFSVVSSSSSQHNLVAAGIAEMNNSGNCITNGQGNNGVVIIQKQPIQQRSASTNEETEDDSEDDMYDDDDMDAQSGDESMNANEEKITSQLASAGPTGMAAAAAISSTKKRKKSFAFETNPSIRKRQQTRILRKLRQNIEEYSLRVGQQAVVLVATPGGGKSSQVNFRAFGAKPLEDVVKNLRTVIMTELETALAQQAPPTPVGDPTRYELPPLVIDGIPTPVEKMTQAQLRAFIPLMLKYSTGRGKPGWGKESTKPPWWPEGVPWANVRMDARKNDDKQKVSWTHALRQIVTNCYEYHCRQDLLPIFSEADAVAGSNEANGTSSEATEVERTSIPANNRPHVYASGTSNDAVSSTPATGLHPVNIKSESISASSQSGSNQTTSGGGIILQHAGIQAAHQPQITSVAQHYSTQQQQQAVVQTISNPDGTISIIHVDPDNPIITLPDGTTAQIQGLGHQSLSPSVLNLISSATANNLNPHTGSVHTLAEVAEHHAAANQAAVSANTHSIELASNGDIHAPEGSQILIAGEDGQAYPVSGMITIPGSSGMYQAVIQGQNVGINAAIADAASQGGQLVQVIGTPVQLSTSNGVQHLVKLDSSNLIKIDHEPVTQVQNSSMQQQQPQISHHPQQQSSPSNLTINGGGSTSSVSIGHGTHSIASQGARNLTITPVPHASPSSTIHHLPSSEEPSTGIANSNRVITPVTVQQLGRTAAVASKTSVTSTTGRNGKDGNTMRRPVSSNSHILSRSSPPGSIQQPDTTGVD